jgi:hypothetical protein
MQPRPTAKSRSHLDASKRQPARQPETPAHHSVYLQIHQLNNKLAIILAHCELMKSRTIPGGLKHLSAIHKAATSIAEMVGEAQVNSIGNVITRLN